MTIFTSKLSIAPQPLILAPLAGVSDSPFRRVCVRGGADLTYVEMISGTALLHNSKNTLAMLYRHPEEKPLGVQVTARNPEEIKAAVAMLASAKEGFETIDINMGCPVKKVVNAGCGSAIIKNPETVYAYTKGARSVCDKPMSVKIRIGWNQSTLNFLEVVDAAQSGGADWITVHGRTRSDTYADPVNLDAIRTIKKRVAIPIIGNGSLFTENDKQLMGNYCQTDGWMISRGSMGNPWAFRHMKTGHSTVTLDEWQELVLWHLSLQESMYENKVVSLMCMRKHLLWYLKGWASIRRHRETAANISSWPEAYALVNDFAEHLRKQGVASKSLLKNQEESRFVWDPKYDMDRTLDRGVGEDML